MKALINGVTREMTSDEITEWENAIEDTSAFPEEPTTEERISALEEELAAAKILLGLEE